MEGYYTSKTSPTWKFGYDIVAIGGARKKGSRQVKPEGCGYGPGCSFGSKSLDEVVAPSSPHFVDGVMKMVTKVETS